MEILLAALPTLIGALVGASASILTTHFANKHSMKLVAIEREERHKSDVRKKQIENYESLQLATIDYARSGVISSFQIREQYVEGKKHSEVRIDDKHDEQFRLNQARFVTLVGRILDDELREQAQAVRNVELQLTLYATNLDELENAFAAHNREYNRFLDSLEAKLRGLYSD